MQTIKLRKDWYWSAGVKYGWSGAGVGIALNKLQGYEFIKIINPKRGVFRITSTKAMDLIRKYNSTEMMGTTTIGVVPVFELEQINI